MPVKINGATSGSVSLAAPASGSDVTLTLPGTSVDLAAIPQANVANLTSDLAAKWTTATAWTALTTSDIAIYQGTTLLSCTFQYAKWMNFGKVAIFQILATITSTGTAGGYIRVTAPSAPGFADNDLTAGSFVYKDSGVAYYTGQAMLLYDGIYGIAHNQPAYIGTYPSFTAANNDTVSITLVYEKA